jgi:hypothetical protein
MIPTIGNNGEKMSPWEHGHEAGSVNRSGIILPIWEEQRVQQAGIPELPSPPITIAMLNAEERP